MQRRVRLVNKRPLAAQSVPAEIRCLGVLDGVVPHSLIIGRGILRANIEKLVVRRVRPRAEGDAEKSGHSDARRCRYLYREIGFDCAVLEVGARQKRETLSCRCVLGDEQRLATFVFHCFQRDVVGD